jgi:hypothetical protein
MLKEISTSHAPRHAVFFEKPRFLLESRVPAPQFIVRPHQHQFANSTLIKNTENCKSG